MMMAFKVSEKPYSVIFFSGDVAQLNEYGAAVYFVADFDNNDEALFKIDEHGASLWAASMGVSAVASRYEMCGEDFDKLEVSATCWYYRVRNDLTMDDVK